jgi:hypothetical protein
MELDLPVTGDTARSAGHGRRRVPVGEERGAIGERWEWRALEEERIWG